MNAYKDTSNPSTLITSSSQMRDNTSFFDQDTYLVNPDGTDLARLPLDNGPGNFAWSPDGNKLIYSGTCKPHGTCLFVANADGSEPQQLPKALGASAALWLP